VVKDEQNTVYKCDEEINFQERNDAEFLKTTKLGAKLEPNVEVIP